MLRLRPDGGQESARFGELLDELDSEALARVGEPTCGLFAADLTIGYVNAAWLEFGRENGAQRVWGVGDRFLDAISGPLRDLVAEGLGRVLRFGEAWDYEYECSSAETYRVYRARTLVLGKGEGVLITHTRRIERPHSEEPRPFVERAYRAATGLVTLCSYCRRVRRHEGPAGWDWVPELLLGRPDRITHGICELCAAYYFGKRAFGR